MGIKLKEFSYDDHSVTMYTGDSLQKILDRRQFPSDIKALKEIPKIYEVLKKNKNAHCDVKPSNLVYLDGKYLLIGNENIVNFGEKRNAGTPELNVLVKH